MKLTPEQLAKWKALVTKLLDDSSDHMGVAHSTDMPPQHTVNFQHAKNAHEAVWAITNLIADLEEAEANRKLSDELELQMTLDNRKLRADLADTRQQLAEAQALLVGGADLLGKVAMNAVDDFVCASGQKYADLMRQADSSALQSSIAEAVEPYRKDAERLNWLEKVCKETPLNQKAFCSEIAPDTRLRFNFPTLVSYDAIGQKISLRDAIDAAIAAKGDSK